MMPVKGAVDVIMLTDVHIFQWQMVGHSSYLFWELLYQHVPIQLVSRPSFYQKVGCEMFVQ